MSSKKFFINMFIILSWILSVQSIETKQNGVSCRDENGEEVDWFFVYKLPKYYGDSGDISGKRYLFITNLDYKKWTLSNLTINESSSIMGQTLEPAMLSDDTYLMAYNDEYPTGEVRPTGGHAKGVVASDGKSGYWLIHSVPKFPSLSQYSYPESGEHYGQSFLCLTLSYNELEKVGNQLRYIQPHVYYERKPIALNEKFPELTKAQLGDWIKNEVYNNSVNIETVKGNSFKSFAKSPRFGMELYEDWVAPTLDVNLLVESWRNGPGNLPSNCSLSDKVYNVKEIENEDLSLSFKSTSDHSKWAVTPKSGVKFWRWTIGESDNWICVGDINRQQHQLQRGGGTVCYKNDDIVKLYRELVGEFEKCN